LSTGGEGRTERMALHQQKVRAFFGNGGRTDLQIENWEVVKEKRSFFYRGQGRVWATTGKSEGRPKKARKGRDYERGARLSLVGQHKLGGGKTTTFWQRN